MQTPNNPQFLWTNTHLCCSINFKIRKHSELLKFKARFYTSCTKLHFRKPSHPSIQSLLTFRLVTVKQYLMQPAFTKPLIFKDSCAAVMGKVISDPNKDYNKMQLWCEPSHMFRPSISWCFFPLISISTLIIWHWVIGNIQINRQHSNKWRYSYSVLCLHRKCVLPQLHWLTENLSYPWVTHFIYQRRQDAFAVM